jgi:hypothetical protein
MKAWRAANGYFLLIHKKFGTLLFYNKLKQTIMVKQTFPTSPEKLNPLFQQHILNGRVHVRDYAFYMRKLVLMQQQKGTNGKKEKGCTA